MAMFVDPLASQLVETLAAVTKEEVGMLVGMSRDLKWLERKMTGIRTVLEDAERKAFHDPTVRTWLADLKGVVYDADDIIDERKTHYESLARLRTDPSSLVRCYSTFFSCFRRVALRHQAGSGIRSIKERLERIIKDQSDLNLIAAAAASRDDHRGGSGGRSGWVHRRQTDPGPEPDIVGVGIESDTSNLVSLLTAEELRAPSSSSSNVVPPQVLAIVGMGGIGKTTLAQKIYNHPTIRDSFRMPPPMWVCVSQDYSDTALLREVIRAAGGADPGGHDLSFAELQGSLTQAIQGKKLLLILDDVWSARVWEYLLRKPLQNCAAGSRILITTRQEVVAKQMRAVHIHNVRLMSTDDGWAMLCRTVFQSGEGIRETEETFRDVGMQIVEKCGGLPLAIKTVSGVLRTKERERREWEKVLGNQAWLLSDHLPEGVMGALYLSYEDLPSHLKRCFIYCSLFPEDFVFRRHYIVQHWIAQGFVREEGNLSMEEAGDEYYKDLIRRSLLQPDPKFYANKGCKMHDLLRSLAHFLARDEYFVGDMEGLAKATTTASSSSTKLLHHIWMVDEHLNSFPDGVKDHKCLRTLFLRQLRLTDRDVTGSDVFLRLGRLRVLDFVFSSINRLPESMGNLTHLRLLDLSSSSISELPEAIGSLGNLWYLNLQQCPNLHDLPNSIVKLYNLRTLDLYETRVSGFPVGIGGLQHLIRLTGFVATNESSIDGRRSGNRGRKPSPDHGWCSLEELTSLCKLMCLSIHSLERGLIRADSRRGIPLLKDKTHLIQLEIHCAPCKSVGQPYGDEEAKRIQELFQEELFPPPSLEEFKINGYFGLHFPSWMNTSDFASGLKNLRRLDLGNCQLCKKLPPLGLLPNLDYLCIEHADAVESIGLEFLGIRSSAAAVESIPPFPKLERLVVKDMPNWVEWLWEVMVGVTMMPCLQSLALIKCPNLRPLPMGLRHATSLQKIYIAGANNLDAIGNLVSVEVLYVLENPNLVRISNLPALRKLMVSACPALREVEGLPSLKTLELTDLKMDILPDWLFPKDEGQQTCCYWLFPKDGGQQTCCFPALAKLNIVVGGVGVLRRCLKGGPDWPKIQHFPNVHIQADDGPEFASYTRDPFTFRTNLGGGGRRQ